MFTIKSELTATCFASLAMILLLAIIGLSILILILFSIPIEASVVNGDNDMPLKFIWETASGDVDHYNVYVSTDEGGYVLVGSASETSYTVTGSDGHTYKVKVEATDAAGNVGPTSPESDPVICDTSPPEAVTDLQAAVSGDSILLEWTAQAETVSYNVYRDTEPDFTPDQTGGSNRIATGVNDEDTEAAGVQWTDKSDGVVGDTVFNYFYAVTAVDAAGNESEPSNKVGEFDIKLIARANNLISLPLTPSEPYTSYSLIEDISSCTKISRFNTGTQSWELVARDGDKIIGSDFPIVEGEGYSVRVSSDTIYTFTGDVIILPITLNLKRGRNLIGIPYFTEPYTSYTLISAIPNCRNITRYNVDTLSLEITSFSRRRGVSGVNFDIKAGEGYYLYTIKDTSWTSSSLAAPVIVPEQTELSQNYPNPFNPETWVPFQLAKNSEVTIRIYNVTGQPIKTIQLGYKQAGVYIEKSKAAYWDGRNDMGEKLASGVYFYELRAGEFRAIRKMILLK